MLVHPILVHRIWTAIQRSSCEDAGFNHHPWKYCTCPGSGPGPGSSKSSSCWPSQHYSDHLNHHHRCKNHYNHQTNWSQLQERCAGEHCVIVPFPEGQMLLWTEYIQTESVLCTTYFQPVIFILDLKHITF